MPALNNFLQWIKNLPDVIKRSIGLITLLVGFVIFVRDNFYLALVVTVTAASVTLFLVALYVFLSKKDSLLVGGSQIHTYPKLRTGASLILLAIPILLLVSLSFQQTRNVVAKAWNGTPTATSTPKPANLTEFETVNGMQVPRIGSRLDFSIGQPWASDLDGLIKSAGMVESPFEGILLSSLENEFNDINPSWNVHFDDGSREFGQTETCLINISYPEYYQSPLNLRVDNLHISPDIFVNENYSLIVTDIELIISNYTMPRSNIQYISSREPGAGGFGLPFRSVVTPRVFVNSQSKKEIIEFLDFELLPNNGVTIIIPVTMEEDGAYQFQIKINGVATANYQGDEEGIMSLTTGRTSWSWINIESPLDFVQNPEDFETCP